MKDKLNGIIDKSLSERLIAVTVWFVKALIE